MASNGSMPIARSSQPPRATAAATRIAWCSTRLASARAPAPTSRATSAVAPAVASTPHEPSIQAR